MAEEERRNSVERVVSGIQSSSSSSGGAGEPSSSAASSSVAVAGDQTSAREDARNNGKKKGSSSSSSSAVGGIGAHTCEKCGRTFATGQSLGGHMRKHYDGPPIVTNKKRTREQPEETPAPTVESRVRMESHFDAPSESHNPPALLSRSAQASDGGDCERNREEPERPSAGDGACRLHNFFPDELPEPEEEPKNAPQPESERKDDYGDDDEWLSLRLGRRSSSDV